MLVDCPLQALKTAAELGEYTLTDFCSWNTIEPETRKQMEIFVREVAYLLGSNRSISLLVLNEVVISYN